MQLFHLIGTECSGKERVAKRIQETLDDVVVWDILENFYKPHQIITETSTDWPKYNKMTDVLVEELKQFLRDNIQGPIIVISTGINKYVNEVMDLIEQVNTVILEVPEIYEIRDEAERRDKDSTRVVGFVPTWEKKIAQRPYHKLSRMEPHEAIVYIIGQINSEGLF